MQEGVTTNGIEYSWQLAGANGASFILFPNKNHTKDMIVRAISELRSTRDVVTIRSANFNDRINRYESEIYKDPRVRNLKSYQFSVDHSLLKTEFQKGTYSNDFVTYFIIPNIKPRKEE